VVAMTIEEAGQAILEGPYTICTRCNGKGFLPVPDGVNVMNTCHSCKGSGQWLRGDYKTACVLLGREMPEPLKSSIWIANKPGGSLLEVDQKLKDYAASDGFMMTARLYESIYKREYMGEWATNEVDTDDD
jgi:hypothetical protein